MAGRDAAGLYAGMHKMANEHTQLHVSSHEAGVLADFGRCLENVRFLSPQLPLLLTPRHPLPRTAKCIFNNV